MALQTTIGQLLVNEALPPELRDYSRVLDGKARAAVLDKVARRYPEQYAQIVKRLNDTGRDIAYTTGAFSFGLDDLLPAETTKQSRTAIEFELAKIRDNPQLDDKGRETAMFQAVDAAKQALVKNVFNEALERGNPLAEQIMSGARGKPMGLAGLIGFDGLYVDHRNNLIPLPILNNYAEGLTPAEYFAGAYGARKGIWDTKKSTADAGYLGKQIATTAHRLLVTQDDADETDDFAEFRGLPVDTDDPDNEGALLARAAGGYPRNTVLTPKVLKHLQTQNVGRLLVRSPLVGGPAIGGVYSRDVGVRERGGLAPKGDFVGIAAAQAISEALTQGSLSSKHAGGVAGADKAVSGFQLINQLFNPPKHFPGGATHAQVSGTVRAIQPAAQGGHYVTVGATEHYVPHERKLQVKLGDEIESGDTLSSGVPNPTELVKHFGIGEARRKFTNQFMEAYRDAGMTAHRRNVELVARGLIDHVRMDDTHGDYLPDDIVPYSRLEHSWEPREGTEHMKPDRAVGKYLERPILHYTIGTPVRKSMLPVFKEFGVENVAVHHEPPPFAPQMVRAVDHLLYDPDWMTKHLGGNIKKTMLDAAVRGGTSDLVGTSYVAPLAERVQFGEIGHTKGWHSSQIQPLTDD